MDHHFHPPISPFKSCQTHRPDWFIDSATFAPRPLHANSSVHDDELDYILDKELKWLHSKQYFWHADWSLFNSISQLWCQGPALLLPLLLHGCHFIILTIWWLPFAWIKSLIGIKLSLDGKACTIDSSLPWVLSTFRLGGSSNFYLHFSFTLL
jgi:hypothetical protein